MTCRAVPLYLNENNKEITMRSYIVLNFRSKWMEYFFSLFFFFFFIYVFHVTKKDNTPDNERTSIHRRPM